MKENNLIWLQEWYKSQCDGEWEHEYGIVIQTLDNPGWTITIDLSYTELEGLVIPHVLIEKAEDDWISYSVREKFFKGAGDPGKLELLLLKFKEIVEQYG